MAFAAIILISAANAIQALENRDLAVLEVPIYADPTMTSNLQRRSTTLQGVQAEVSCGPTLFDDFLSYKSSGVIGIYPFKLAHLLRR